MITILPLAGRAGVSLTDRDGEPTAFCTQLRDYVGGQKEPFAFVGVDPLARLASGDVEKDNAMATAFMSAVESLIPPRRIRPSLSRTTFLKWAARDSTWTCQPSVE